MSKEERVATALEDALEPLGMSHYMDALLDTLDSVGALDE